MSPRLKYGASSSGKPSSPYSLANTKVTRAITTAMARPQERCIGETISISNGRQLGDQCKNRAYILQNNLCHKHQYQHNNPSYPTRNSYRLRSDERSVTNRTSRTEIQPDVSQAGASTSQRPVDTPSRTTASAEPSQPNPLRQQPASSSHQPQLQTPPKQSGHRRRATPEPPGRFPLHTHTPTLASNAVSGSLRPHNLPTPPATESRLSNDDICALYNQPPNTNPAITSILRQIERGQSTTPEPNPSHATSPEPPGRMPLQINRPTQALNPGRSLRSHNLPTSPATERRVSSDDIRALYSQPPTANPAITGRVQTATFEPHPSHATSPELSGRIPLHTYTPTEASNPGRSLRSHNLPTPPATKTNSSISPPTHPPPPPPSASSSPLHRSSNRNAPEDSAPLRTHLASSTSTSTPPPPRHPPTTPISPTIVPTKIAHYNSLTYTPLSLPSSSRTPHDHDDDDDERSRIRAATKRLYDLHHELQLAGECPDARPLGFTCSDDEIELESTSSSIPNDNKTPTILDIILQLLHAHTPPHPLDLTNFPNTDALALKLIKRGCDVSEAGRQFREGLRRWMERGGVVDEGAVAAFGLDD